MISAIGQLLVICALALLPAMGEAFYLRHNVPWSARLTADETVDLITAKDWGANVIWVDARPDDEFASDHAPGAISLNEDRWNELLPQFLAVWSPGKKVVGCDCPQRIASRA